jgi:DNA invertase Pin-like site-specific DNA recombinase
MTVFAEIETLSPVADAAVAASASALEAKIADDAAMAATDPCGSVCLSVPAIAPVTAPSVKACGYVRTSSMSNIGENKDSEDRQKLAISQYAQRAGLHIAEWFHDPGVSGADALEARPGFAAMLAYCAEHGVATIVLESASRFARDAMIAELGYRSLKKSGFVLIASDDPSAFVNSTPTGDLIRGILSNVSQFERANLCAKLRGSRDRRSAAIGKRIEGRKGYDDTKPELVAAAKALRASGLAQRAIASRLFEFGHATSTGKVMSAGQIGRLLRYA